MRSLIVVVVWLNERSEDFALYGELEKAFFRNHRKLDVNCIVERDLYGHQLMANPNVREAAPDFKIGTLAAVAGDRPVNAFPSCSSEPIPGIVQGLNQSIDRRLWEVRAPKLLFGRE